MMSAIPATLFPSADSVLGNQFPSFENSFTPPWDCSDLFTFPDDQSPKAVVSSSGSDDPNEPNKSNQNHANSNCSSDDPNPITVSMIDDRKRRRMISNRESARRSRMRKQRHLENLRYQVNKLKIENRELTNRLRLVLYHCNTVRRDNEQLRYEHSMLRQKLSNIRQFLMLKQLQQFTSAWPCNNTTTTE